MDHDNDTVMELADACVLDGPGDTTLAWLDHYLTNLEKESDILFNANYVTGTEEGKTESMNVLQYTAGVQSYIARTTGTTPTVAGLVCADDQLASSNADMRIVILMSDGDPSTNLNGDSCSGESCVSEIVSIRDTMVADGIQIYSAALTSESDLIGYMAHFSSDTCGNDYDNVADCDETNDIEYAYSASTAEDLEVMYQTIINSILGLTMKFTTEIDGETVVTGGPVREGDDVELIFPDGFECPQGDDEWTVPLRVTFNGEGIAKISDIQLTYCPVRE